MIYLVINFTINLIEGLKNIYRSARGINNKKNN